MLLADTLSRYTPLSSNEIELDVTIRHVCIGDTCKASLQELTRTDLLLRSLAETIINGWPEDPKDIPEALQPYWNHRDTMTVEDGIILWGEAILIPPTERGEILQQIHEGHQGITKSQLCIRNCVYWPGINKDIQCMIKACETCQHFRPRQSHAPLKATPPPSRPWQRLGTDLFEFDRNDYIVIADYYSNMPFLLKIPRGQCNAAKVISILKEVFSEHGVPETLISDNGPQYSSALFAKFADEWKFTHVTSSPHHPEGNGFAKSMVKVVKQMLQHAKYSGSDSHLALLSYRATPLDSKIASPAELMYQRHLQSTLPSCLRNTAPDAEDTRST